MRKKTPPQSNSGASRQYEGQRRGDDASGQRTAFIEPPPGPDQTASSFARAPRPLRTKLAPDAIAVCFHAPATAVGCPYCDPKEFADATEGVHRRVGCRGLDGLNASRAEDAVEEGETIRRVYNRRPEEKKLNVLISGAGIAGCTLAYWLARSGHSVTVMERSRSLRSSGSPVDVRGPAVDVAERMNVLAQLRKARIQLQGMTLLDAAGLRIARVDIEALRSSIVPRDLEIARDDLSRILHAASANDAEYVFGDSIKMLSQDTAGVDVTFEQSPSRRFDLVIGADGLHSIVRRLAFGADPEFVKHAGLYAATVPLIDGTDTGREMFMLNVPGKLVALHPRAGAPLAYFVFWHPEIPKFDYTNLDQHKSILERNFAGMGWRVPEFIAAVEAANDLYFDSVARVHVADWARGRIALLGDAASCVSLFGDGSTLAIAGAYELAKALDESSTDPRSAFARYQSVHGKRVASKQKNLGRMAARIIPKTSAGIWVSTRIFWKGMAGIAAGVRLVRKMNRKQLFPPS
jgi:2-polyprenyl-6-methoxyphenol hydroxylase-like FAD-dependent oxidoreductase